jgi:hypothetical protein
MTEYGYRGPTLDQSLLSPNGRMSKAARAAAMRREARRLFPPGFWDKPQATPEEQLKQKVDGLRSTAKTLRDLAARGMNRHRYTKDAAKLEAQADSMLANARGDSSEYYQSGKGMTKE